MKFEKELPANPSFEYLKREARAMKSRHRNKDPQAAVLIGHFDISLHGLASDEILSRKFSIIDAQRVVARRFGLSSWAKLKRYVLQGAVDASVADPKLRQEVKARADEIKGLVERIRKQSGHEKKKDLDVLYKLGREVTLFLNPVFDRYGWPGPNVIGRDGVEACWWLVGHSTLEGELQFRAAELMKKAFSCGDIPGPEFVMIIDRCLALSVDTTLFGSIHQYSVLHDCDHKQWARERVLNPNELDRRRARVGLSPHKHFRSEMLSLGKQEGWEVDHEMDRRHREFTAAEGGYREASKKYRGFIESLA